MVTTRIATLADLDAILRLMNEFHSSPTTKDAILPQLEKITSSDDSAVMVVEDERGVQGMAIVDLLYKLPKIECRINEVVVSAASRGKGYGALIMEACDAWAWQHDASTIEFSSRPSREAANALYQKLGYTLRDTNVYSRER